MTPKAIHEAIESDFPCSERTVRRDINKMDEWLPQVLGIKVKAEDISIEMIKRLRLAQARLARLTYTADSGSAQVGAAKALIASLSEERELMVAMGTFKPVTKTEVEVKRHEWSLSELIEEFGDVLPEALEAYTQAAREDDARGDAKEDSGESMVPDSK